MLQLPKSWMSCRLSPIGQDTSVHMEASPPLTWHPWLERRCKPSVITSQLMQLSESRDCRDIAHSTGQHRQKVSCDSCRIGRGDFLHSKDAVDGAES